MTAWLGRDANTSTSIDAHVLAEQVSLLYDASSFSLISTLVASAIRTWPYAPHRQSIAWLVASVVWCTLRYALVTLYRRAPPRVDQLRAWAHWSVGGTFVAGLLWGITGSGLMTYSNEAVGLLAGMVNAAILGIGLLSLYPYYPAFVALALPLILPAIAHFAIASAPSNLAAVTLATYLVIALGGARRLSVNTEALIRLRLETADLAEAHERAKDAAEASSRARGAFLANMSHELRTPLNAVIGYSELLTEIAEEAKLVHFIPDLAKIRGAGTHLLALIGDVLDLAKVEANRSEFTSETVELSSFTELLTGTVEVLAQRAGNRFTLHVEPEIGTIGTDPKALRQVLLNLLSNANKFTTKGSVELRISRWDPQSHRPGVLFVVSDTGIGIAKEHLEHVFEEFYQVDAFFTRRVGGTGLGLAIARRMAVQLGGTLDVQSALGVGTSFHLWLPTAPPVPETADAA